MQARKIEAYDKGQILNSLSERVKKIIEETTDTNEKLLAICKLFKNNVPHYDWVGFYLVHPSRKRELVLGPFVGEPTEHVTIPFGKGICGQAAEEKRTIIVPDVSEETNYLSCSINVKSEIVVPILKNVEYLFSWDEITTNDNAKASLRNYLIKKFSANWLEKAEIRKSVDGLTISASDENNSISLRFNDEKTILTITDDGKIDYLVTRTKNSKLNICDGEVVGEIDIDSHTISAFTEDDKKLLEDVCESVSTLF